MLLDWPSSISDVFPQGSRMTVSLNFTLTELRDHIAGFQVLDEGPVYWTLQYRP